MRTVTMVVLALSMVGGCKKKLLEQPPGSSDTGDNPGDDDDDDGSGDDDDDDDDDAGIRFDAHVIGDLLGARYAATGDLDGDGVAEIVVGASNNITEADIPFGWVSVLEYQGDLDSWGRTDVIGLADRVRSPNAPTLGDLDNDGDLDIVVGFGSRYCEIVETIGACGGIAVLINDNGSFTLNKLINNSLYYFTSVGIGDINGDGNADLATTQQRTTLQEEEAFTQVFFGRGDGTFQNAVNVGPNLGSLTQVVDVDGDGDNDLISGEQVTGNSFAWYENEGSGTSWSYHVIYDNLGDGYLIRLVDDLYGDGVTRAVASNHTNTESPKQANPDLYDSVLVAFEIPSNPALQWSSFDRLSDGILPTPDLGLFPNDAPGAFDFGDADGDGDLDILLAGDGDPTVYLLDQVAPGEFVTRVLRNNVVLSGGASMVDFNGDGAVEFVVTSFGADAVFVIERVTE